MKRNSTLNLIIAATLLLLITNQAQAEYTNLSVPDHPALSDTFRFGLGIYFVDTSTVAALGSPSGGTAIGVDFENSLGLDDQTDSGLFNFVWNFHERWRLEAEYFAINRNATRTINSEIEWGDQTYPVGTKIDSVLNIRDIRLSGTYIFFKRPDKQLGAGIGFHVMGINASLDEQSSPKEEGDVLAPLPVINLYGLFALTDEWALQIRADWLSLDYQDYSGNVRNYSIDVLYQPFEHLGFGISSRNLTIDLEMKSDDWTGRTRMNFNGPGLYVTYSF